MEGDLTVVSSAPLVEVCELLSIGTSDLAAVEDADTLAYTFTVQSEDAARLDPAHVRAFTDHYGDAASIVIRTGDLTELVLEPGVTDAAVVAFTAQAVSGGPYEVLVQVDKVRLAQRIVGQAPARKVRVFLFAEALRRSIARGIARFEVEVWPEAPAPLVLAVLDTDINLTGPHLTILGGAFLADARMAASAAPVEADFEALTASRDQYIGWDTRWVRALTPWHFDLAGTSDDAALHGLLRAQLVKLAVLFTCDRARTGITPTPPGEILAEFRGREHVAVVRIGEGIGLDATDQQTSAVLRAVSWCYERHGTQGQPDWVSDRLPFVQTRVAQVLEPHLAAERVSLFASTMPYLLEGIEWQWKAFIEGKVGEFLDRVQQIETVVTDTVSAFAERTGALVKHLTDAILAAVAVLIGSFIAAAFKTPFNATLFRIGVLTYAGYLLLFPGAVGLYARTRDLIAARGEFDARVQRFNDTLYPEKVNEIVANRVNDAQCSFYRWVAFAALIYVAVAITATLAAATVPDLIRRDPANRQPVPTSTTTTPTGRQNFTPAPASAWRLGSGLGEARPTTDRTAGECQEGAPHAIPTVDPSAECSSV